MASRTELSASQLAALDLLIAQKRVDPGLAADWAQAVNNLGNSVVGAVAAAAAVAAVVAVHNVLDSSINKSIAVARNASLNDLLEIRKNAIVSK